MAYNKKDFPLCEKEIDLINNKFVDKGWITLYNPRVFAAMVSDELLPKAMKNDSWELNELNARPFINEVENTASGYSRFYNPGVEPIVIAQEAKCNHNKVIRLCEEMVLFYDLRIVPQDKDGFQYVLVDECGNDICVAQYKDDTLIAHVKYIKEFIAVKEMNLLVQFDIDHTSPNTLTELGTVKQDVKQFGDEERFFTFLINDNCGIISEQRTFALIRGKVCYKHSDADIKLLWNAHEDGKESFIVGLDDNGEELISTCDEKLLPNLFTWDGQSVYTLTPVYFKHEVLRKYYDDPVKYSVQDGYITGPTWGVHADTDRNDGFIAITLVDLGRMPYKEQQYWRHYNVVPPQGAALSDTTYKRWIAGEACDTQNSPDFIFKHVYSSLNNEWDAHYGWKLFKPLAKADQFRFETLHTMTSRDNDTEFHALMQSLIIILVDSLNEAEIGRGINLTNADVQAFMTAKSIVDMSSVKGISKFELFLISEGKRNDDLIKLWRNIQDLRSTSVAHRKSSHPDKKQKELLAWCGLDTGSQRQVFNRILVWAVEKMKWLRSTL